MAKYQVRGVGFNGHAELPQDIHPHYAINLQYRRKLKNDCCDVGESEAANAEVGNSEQWCPDGTALRRERKGKKAKSRNREKG